MNILDVILSYGTVMNYCANGVDFVVLPTAVLSGRELAQYYYENIAHGVPMGNFRSVVHLSSPVSLYVKSPERVFTAERHLLDQEYVWWGGCRSGEKRVVVQSPIVEEQVDWEAIFLLQLLHCRIRAEIPQAVVTHRDGRKELITLDVRSSIYDSANFDDVPWSDLQKCTHLVPEDTGGHNSLSDSQGNSVVIDVNRWSWPEYSNISRRRLKEEILQKI